jgi:hypothetical protein
MSVAARHFLLLELVWVPDTQRFPGIERHLDESTARCRMTRIAGFGGLRECFSKLFVIAVLDGILQRLEARLQNEVNVWCASSAAILALSALI